jgi:hypothetical protein
VRLGWGKYSYGVVHALNVVINRVAGREYTDVAVYCSIGRTRRDMCKILEYCLG